MRLKTARGWHLRRCFVLIYGSKPRPQRIAPTTLLPFLDVALRVSGAGTHTNYLRLKRPAMRGGFTLIEALAAILLMALILPTALGGVSEALRASSQLRHQQQALVLAQSQLAQLLIDDSWQNSAQAGAFAVANFGAMAAGYQWSLTVSPWRDPQVSSLEIRVSWSDRPQDCVRLNTLVLPEQSL